MTGNLTRTKVITMGFYEDICQTDSVESYMAVGSNREDAISSMMFGPYGT